MQEESKSHEVPKSLSREQIEDILSVIEPIPSAHPEASRYLTEQIKDIFRFQLMISELLPSKIGELKKRIQVAYVRSLAEYGEAVGVLCSEAIGAPASQIVLSSFHTAGSALDASAGIKMIKNVTNIGQNHDVMKMYIHFRNKHMNYSDCLAMRKHFVETPLNSLLVNKQIQIRRVSQIAPAPWWHRWHKKIESTRNMEIYGRLNFDANKLFMNEITLHDIVRELSNTKSSGMIVCIPSPSVMLATEGICCIDVYCTDDGKIVEGIKSVKGIKKDTKIDVKIPKPDRQLKTNTEFYLESFLVESMEKVIIKGIQNVRYILPREYNISNAIRESTKGYLDQQDLTYKKDGNIWTVWLNKMAMQIEGVPISRVDEFMEFCFPGQILAYPVTQEPILKLATVKQNRKTNSNAPWYYVVTSDIKPKEVIEAKVGELRREGREDELKYFYIETIGSGLATAISLTDEDGNYIVDHTTSVTDSIREMNAVFGLIAAKNKIARVLHTIISNISQSMSPANYQTIADFQTSNGLVPISSKGVFKLNKGALTNASFEQVDRAFDSAAARGKTETTSTVSSCIFVGRQFSIGTGAVKLVVRQGLKKSTGIPQYEEESKQEYDNPIQYDIVPDDLGNEDGEESNSVENIALESKLASVLNGDNAAVKAKSVAAAAAARELVKKYLPTGQTPYPIWKFAISNAFANSLIKLGTSQ